MVNDGHWERDGPYLRHVEEGFTLTLLVGMELEAPLDVMVELSDGVQRFATIFTPDSIGRIQKKDVESGECLNGRYFWAKNIILVDTIDSSLVESIVLDLIRSGEIYHAFGTER
ncbi:hypothetical protein [Frankia sp. Cas4]|uniref:hypothetical protein n=1 Tax=Frankia sp. Cas4 TaxID=3073927 RepID=UPI002AD4B2F8|nr:hypothetical protein [Frankia sp. Cas4]